MSPPPRLGSVPPQLPKNQTLPEHGAGRNRCSPQPECGAIRAFAAPNAHEGSSETTSLSEPRVEPSEGRRERAVAAAGAGSVSTRPFAAVFAARPLTLAGILANSGAPFAAPKVHEGFRDASETASLSEPRVERPKAARTSGHTPGQEAFQRGRSRQFSQPDRSLWPEFLRIPAPRSRLRRCAGASVTQTKRRRFQSREWSRPKDGENERSHPGAGGALQGGRSRRFSQQDRSLWPEFLRIPAPRSRLRRRMSVAAPPRAPLGACQMKKIIGWPAARRVRAPSESG